jgi:glycerophosphoryl diester phosphodiesterase
MLPSSGWSREAPLVIAHRGASSRAPENTLEAFRLAAEMGAHAIELDAKLSADGQVIVFHDPTLERLTGVEGRPGLRTFAELRRLDVGAWKGAAFRGARIPLLEEVFLGVDERLLINVELTNYFTPKDGLVDAVVALVRTLGMDGRVLFSSFFRRNLARAKRLAPDIPCGHLVGPTPLAVRDLFGGVPVATEAIHPYLACATPGLVRRTHRAGRRVFVFTVNDPVRLRAMWRRGVDGVITDDPETARRTITDAG